MPIFITFLLYNLSCLILNLKACKMKYRFLKYFFFEKRARKWVFIEFRLIHFWHFGLVKLTTLSPISYTFLNNIFKNISQISTFFSIFQHFYFNSSHYFFWKIKILKNLTLLIVKLLLAYAFILYFSLCMTFGKLWTCLRPSS